MFQSKDGKRFGSAFVARRRDAEHDKTGTATNETAGKSPNDVSDIKNPVTETEQGSKEQTGTHEPTQVVAEHGKATSVHLVHDHKTGKHHVTSTHEDGHVHESDHASPKEAHDAGSALAAAGDQPDPNAENPDMDSDPEADGFHMPKLA